MLFIVVSFTTCNYTTSHDLNSTKVCANRIYEAKTHDISNEYLELKSKIHNH